MEVWFALGITLLAGLATGIGSIIAFTAKRTNYRFLSIATGFSAGVMLYVSFVEIFFKGLTALTERFGDYWGHWVNAGSFFGGMLIIGLIDNLIPAGGNPHEIRTETETMPLHDPSAPLAPSPQVSTALHLGHDHHHHKLMRMGLFTALAIGIHNFPEGIATFTSAVDNMALGVAIAVAIAIHNIPEGIAVSIPIYYATGDRRKAFRLSLLSGLAEPVGAVLAYLVLTPFMTPTLMGCILAGVAGIMVFISIDELLPAAREYGEAHISIYGVVAGMALMAVSLILLA